MRLVDTHAHLDLLEGEVEEHLRLAREAGVVQVAAVGIDLASSRLAVRLARRHDMVRAVVGVHPHDASKVDEATVRELRALAEDPVTVAVGETGLDFYRDRSPREDQERSFRLHLELAREVGKPVVVHDREAHRRTLEILEGFAPFASGLVLHCFSGDLEMARACMEMGGYISLAGPVTFTNAASLRETARRLPLQRMLAETDSPFLSPHPFRGKPNTPARVALVVEALASLKGLGLEEAAETLTANWLELTGQAAPAGR
jgi:TatD DNase family protein